MGGLARVWLALAGLVGGVLCSGAGAPVAVVLGSTGIAASLRRRGAWRGIGLATLAFSCGIASASARSVDRQPVAALAASVPSCEMVGRTLEEAGGLGLLASADRTDCAGEALVDAGVVFLDGVTLPPGRAFTARGWLVPLRHEGFDLGRRRAGAGAVLDATDARDLGPAGDVHALAHRVRTGLKRAATPLGAAGALLRGLTIGDTAGIDRRTEEAMRRSGLAHLLAVSGSNVAILLGAVAFAASRARLGVRVACCAGALVSFVAVVGPDASVLRAGGMGAVALIALASGRRSEPLHALGLALVAVVALRPGIVYSAGLHLSVAATAGIVLWAQPVAARLRRLPRPLALAAGATVAAQVAVTPLLAGIFGEVPLLAFPANVLALPAVAPVTVLGLAAGALGAAAPAPAEVLVRLAAPFAAWILRVAEAAASPQWALLQVPRACGALLAVPVAAAALRSVPRKLSPPARTLVEHVETERGREGR